MRTIGRRSRLRPRPRLRFLFLALPYDTLMDSFGFLILHAVPTLILAHGVYVSLLDGGVRSAHSLLQSLEMFCID
jgi:hypothetical protein